MSEGIWKCLERLRIPVSQCFPYIMHSFLGSNGVAQVFRYANDQCKFAKVTSHAISAAKYIRRVLTVNPDLMLMPFFLGIYLLQGSFVLLAIVDRVESEASQDVFSACETIVHAHEVCIVTLNTEYQRNFRRVMRSTMSLLSSDQTQPQASPSQSGGQKHTPSSISSLSPTNPSTLGGKHRKTFTEKEEARRRCQVVLGLYRWIAGGHGLAV